MDGKTRIFTGFKKEEERPAPKGIQEIDLTPEIVKRSRTMNGVRYEELVESLRTAHSHGRGIAVDAKLYWKDASDRTLYMTLRRLGQRNNIHIKSDRTHREKEGVVFLWMEEIEGKAKGERNTEPPRRSPGRPRKSQ